MLFPDYVMRVISMIEANGHKAYAVGGCVRDFLLNRPCSDYDIATSARPHEIKTALCSLKTLETGIKHGTITVLIDGHSVEITTFRTEGLYSDHRRPDFVSFADDIVCDLARRDFTVNAMACSQDGSLIDPFNGKIDLENRVLRCVRNADERFCEDALRILRALRFCSQLGFTLEDQTAASVLKNIQLLRFVSKERIFSELKKILTGPGFEKVASEFLQVFLFLFPKFDLSSLSFSAENYLKKEFCSLPCDFPLRFAALFRLCASDSGRGAHIAAAQLACDCLKELKADRATQTEVSALLTHLPLSLSPEPRQIKHFLSDFSFEQLSKLVLLEKAAVHTPSHDDLDRLDVIQNTALCIIQNGECCNLNSLSVNGDDLKKLGFSGKEIGEVLNLLLSAVIDQKVSNERSELLKLSQEIKNMRQN